MRQTVPVRVGQILGDRYRLDELIGQGGTSTVWRGADTVLGRQVAVKVLAGASLTRQAYRSSIRTDARAAASLSHPNVAAVFDYGEYTDRLGEQIPYVVMELLHGRSLSQRLLDGPLEPPLALRVCAQVAGALAAAHASALVHRDIKPGNVVLTRGGAKVIDFGLAAPVGQLDGAPGTPVFGTAAYLAPERLAGAPVTAASDVYALGLLLFRALTSQLPWPAETATEMIRAHVYADPAALPDLLGVPAAVRDLASRCLAKQPSDRPSARTAAIVLADAAMIAPPLGEDQNALVVGPPSAGGDLVEPGGTSAPHRATGGAGSDPPAVGAHLVAATAARSDGPEVAAPASGRLAASPRRRVLLIGAVAAAILVVAVLAPAILDRAPLSAAGTTGLPTPGLESAAPASLDPVGAVPSKAAPDASTVGTTLPAGSPASSAELDVADATSTPAATETPTTTSPPQTFTSAGGSVDVTCQGSMAVLTAWTPNPTYTVKNVAAGPAKVARVAFQSTVEKLVAVMRVTCDNGVPSVTQKSSNLD